MNNKLIEEITILETWDKEIIQIPFSIEEWLTAKIKAKNSWEDWIFLKSQKRFLKFSNIKDEQWKTKHLSLEAPKEEYKERSPKDRKKIDEAIKKAMKITFDWRKKRFLEYRETILKQLEKQEIWFWLDTTNSKLEDYKKLKILSFKNKI